MRKYRGAAWSAVLAIGTALVLAACGSSGSSSSSSAAGGSSSSSSSGSSSGGTVTLMMGTAPDSLDPGFGYTTQSAEPTGSPTPVWSPTRTRAAPPAVR